MLFGAYLCECLYICVQHNTSYQGLIIIIIYQLKFRQYEDFKNRIFYKDYVYIFFKLYASFNAFDCSYGQIKMQEDK